MIARQNDARRQLADARKLARIAIENGFQTRSGIHINVVLSAADDILQHTEKQYLYTHFRS